MTKKNTLTTTTTIAPNPPATPNLPANNTDTNSCQACKTWEDHTHSSPSQLHPLLQYIQTGMMKIGMEKEGEKDREERASRKRTGRQGDVS